MADVEAKKLLAGLWAESGDRTDPDDTTLTPPIVRIVGYPASFSSSGGDTPRRRPVNQRFREFDGAASDSMRYGGALPYDAELNYFQYAHCTSTVDEYVCNTANGPATSNVTSPLTSGQTIWERVAGEINLPSALTSLPTAISPSPGTLVWTWACPLDGGSMILDFDFQWRVQGTAIWTTVVTQSPRVELTGLTNGVAIEAQVSARNAIGDSLFSGIGLAIPRATVPGQVQSVVGIGGT